MAIALLRAVADKVGLVPGTLLPPFAAVGRAATATTSTKAGAREVPQGPKPAPMHPATSAPPRSMAQESGVKPGGSGPPLVRSTSEILDALFASQSVDPVPTLVSHFMGGVVLEVWAQQRQLDLRRQRGTACGEFQRRPRFGNTSTKHPVCDCLGIPRPAHPTVVLPKPLLRHYSCLGMDGARAVQ
jgi:hypothetical protein